MRVCTCQLAFQKTLKDWVTAPRGEPGHRRGRRQDSAEPPLHPTLKQKDVPQLQTQNYNNMLKYSCACLLLLTEEPFVLVRGNVIRCEELTNEGHVKCAVILACTFF